MTFALQYCRHSLGPKMVTIASHCGAWAAFILYESVMLYIFSERLGNIGQNLIFYTLNIGLFYLQACAVLPYAYNRPTGPVVSLLLLLLAEIAAYLFIKYLIDYYLESFRLSLSQTARIARYALINGWRGAYFIGFGTVYFMLRRLFSFQQAIAAADRRQLVLLRDKAEAQKDLAEINNAYLQQQINPHFLFNTLNFVYNSVYKYSPAASRCILQLAEMMRYSLSNSDASGKSFLAAEAEQIRNLVAINRLRYDFELFVDFEISGEMAELKIIPLALLTLAENVFKHGNLKSREMPAKILLSVSGGDHLRFITWNFKKRQNTLPKVKSIGLQNTIKRLDHTYGDRYKLEVADEAGSYRLELNILL